MVVVSLSDTELIQHSRVLDEILTDGFCGSGIALSVVLMTIHYAIK